MAILRPMFIFPSLSDVKLKDEIFTGPDIWELFKHSEVKKVMSTLAQNDFKNVVSMFLRNKKDSACKILSNKR